MENNNDNIKNSLGDNKKIILAFCILALISATIALYFTISYNFSKQAAISKLKNAILKNDSKTILTLMKSSDEKLILNNQNVNMFVTYLNKNLKSLNELILTLNKQAVTVDVKNNDNRDASFKYYVILKKSPKNFLCFNTYYFEIRPCYVNFSTIYPKTKLYADNKYICTSGKGNYLYACTVPFIPGTHKIKTICENSLGKVETEQSMNFMCPVDDNNKNSTISCTMPVNAKILTIYSNIANVEVYINGKISLEMKPEAVSGSDYALKIGPINNTTNATMYIQKTFPWGTFKSKELKISSDTPDFIELDIEPINNDVMNNIKLAIAKYNKETIIPGLKIQRPSAITDGLYIGENMQTEFDTLSSKNIYFRGDYLNSDIDNNSIHINSDIENRYFATIVTKDYFDQDYGVGLQIAPIKTSKNGIINTYTAIYDEYNNSWTINKIILK